MGLNSRKTRSVTAGAVRLEIQRVPGQPSDRSTPLTPGGSSATAPGPRAPSMAFAKQEQARLLLGPPASAGSRQARTHGLEGQGRGRLAERLTGTDGVPGSRGKPRGIRGELVELSVIEEGVGARGDPGAGASSHINAGPSPRPSTSHLDSRGCCTRAGGHAQ